MRSSTFSRRHRKNVRPAPVARPSFRRISAVGQRPLTFEGLEDRRMLSAFNADDASLSLQLFSSETLDIQQNDSTHIQFLLGSDFGDTWSGTDAAGVSGNGTATLTMDTSVATLSSVTVSGNGSAVTVHGPGDGTPFPFSLDWTSYSGDGSVLFTGGASEFTGRLDFDVPGNIDLDAPVRVDGDTYYESVHFETGSDIVVNGALTTAQGITCYAGGSIVVNADIGTDDVSLDTVTNDDVSSGSIQLETSSSDLFLNAVVATGDADLTGGGGGAAISGGIGLYSDDGSIYGNSAGRVVTGSTSNETGYTSSSPISVSAAGEVRLAAEEALHTGDAVDPTGQGGSDASGGITIDAGTRVSWDRATGKLSLSIGHATPYAAANNPDLDFSQGELQIGGDPSEGIFVVSPQTLWVYELSTAAGADPVDVEATTGNLIFEGNQYLSGDEVTFSRPRAHSTCPTSSSILWTSATARLRLSLAKSICSIGVGASEARPTLFPTPSWGPGSRFSCRALATRTSRWARRITTTTRPPWT